MGKSDAPLTFRENCFGCYGNNVETAGISLEKADRRAFGRGSDQSRASASGINLIRGKPPEGRLRIFLADVVRRRDLANQTILL
jgi:hypothetical protein